MTADQGEPGYSGRLNQSCVTIAEVLKEAGYFTAMTGKWHVGSNHDVTPWDRGFDHSLNLPAGGIHFSGQNADKEKGRLFLNGVELTLNDPKLNPPWYGSDLWTDQGIEFIDEAIADNRPFFWCLAHTAPHFPCMAPEATIAKYRGKYRKGWDALREERYARQAEMGLIEKSWDLEPRPDEIPAWDFLSADDQARYDDIMATCVDIAGAQYPVTLNGNTITPTQGQSLKPLLTGVGEFADRPLFWEHEGNAAVRVGDLKLVRLSGKPCELFDLKTDRTEQHDLANSRPEDVESLAARWQRWASQSNVLPKPSNKKATGERRKKSSKRKQRSKQARTSHSAPGESPGDAIPQ